MAKRVKEAHPDHPKSDKVIRVLEICITGERTFVDHYAVLGITADATKEMIKKAYRETQRLVHPDKLPKLEDHTNRASIMATDSKSLLMDDSKRVKFNMDYFRFISVPSGPSAYTAGPSASAAGPSTTMDPNESPSGPAGFKKYKPEDYSVYEPVANTYGATYVSFLPKETNKNFRPVFTSPRKKRALD